MNNPLRYLAYPPSSLPVRDLFVLDHVELNKDSNVMEIGVGCGETTARMAGLCRRIVGVDISGPAIDALSYLKDMIPNMELVCMDVTSSEASIGSQFKTIVSLDTLEHVSDPEAFFGFIWRHLAEGGTAHVLFPNETIDTMHGITRFSSEPELRAITEHGGAGHVELYHVEPNRWARAVIALSYGWFRRLRRPARTGSGAPQQFDQTAFFRRINTWKRLSLLINAYWYMVLWMCRWVRPVYICRPVNEDDFKRGNSLYVRLIRST